MKKLIIATSLFTLSTLLFSTANADDDTGFYAGIGLHRSRFKAGNLDTAKTKGSLSLGYMFNDRIGVDLTRSIIDNSQAFDAKTLSISGVYKVPVSNRFDVYGKLGVAKTDAKITDTINNTVLLDESGTDLMIAIGAKMDFGKHNILLEYTKFDPTDGDLDLVQLGYRYEF